MPFFFFYKYSILLWMGRPQIQSYIIFCWSWKWKMRTNSRKEKGTSSRRTQYSLCSDTDVDRCGGCSEGEQIVNREWVRDSVLVLYFWFLHYTKVLTDITAKGGKMTLKTVLWGVLCCTKSSFCFHCSTVVRRADLATFIVHLFSPQLLLSAMHVFHLAFKCTVPKIADK